MLINLIKYREKDEFGVLDNLKYGTIKDREWMLNLNILENLSLKTN